MAAFLATFDLNRQFQNMGCCRYFILVSQNWFDVDILNFQIQISFKFCKYFGIFGLGDCFGYFLTNLLGHPIQWTKTDNFCSVCFAVKMSIISTKKEIQEGKAQYYKVFG
jgi:hypothetical protein